MGQRNVGQSNGDTGLRLGIALASLGIVACFVLAIVTTGSTGTLGTPHEGNVRMASLEASPSR